MPTIEINKDDLDRLLGRSLSSDELDHFLPLAKAELKDFQPDTGEMKIELNDTNRPDLWSLGGFARQLKIKMTGVAPAYSFFGAPCAEDYRIEIDPELEKIRPFIGAFSASGPPISESQLIQLIQTQEKLSENYGRRRLTLSLGIYELSNVSFPVKYQAVDPNKTSFIPLGYESEMSLNQILQEHPKGQEYSYILENLDKVPYFVDNLDGVLSFPPIINSRRSGEIKPGETEFFIEATGVDMNTVMHGLNIFACNLADQGFEIQPVLVEYPYETPLGRKITTPYHFNKKMRVSISDFTNSLGQDFDAETIILNLEQYGIPSHQEDQEIIGKLPSYRLDYLHPVDMIEDFSISIGYNSFEPLMPADFTVGRLSETEEYSDKVRQLMIGYGFEEIISNILISKRELTDLMGHEDAAVLEVANPMTLAHASLRNSIIPSLMRIEAASPKSAYPHKIFEVGDIVVADPQANLGSRTNLSLGVLIAHPSVNFSEMDSFLTILMFHLGQEFSKKPTDFPALIPGRSGQILVQGINVGVIGEIAPLVLEKWNIGVPVSVFEIDLQKLFHL
ncbi:phenylalanine--tRNA ligase subunit beta [candidate division CSSED10-310 bacterium]|uniref:phenylalanine--tRNA ligase n=1 Tax=candidate division CSSED10-310 bacterium TaxID=2855610 RepID=A0ABV6YTA0_UNCC1